MSDWLREALKSTCVAHGIAAEAEGLAVRIQDGLIIEPTVVGREHPTGSIHVQADFRIRSPRLGELPLLDSFSGLGATLQDAQHDAYGKFAQGSFHVLIESLTTHPGAADRVEWEVWTGPAGAWRVCSGPLLMIATRGGARIEGYPEFFAALADRIGAALSPGPHWLRIFIGAVDGGHIGSEVVVDGGSWGAGQQLLDGHAWTYPPGYASLRHLLIALPKGAA